MASARLGDVRHLSRASFVLAGILAIAGATGACRRADVPPLAERETPARVHVSEPQPGALALPLRDGSVRFAVIGDSGRGDRAQHDVAAQMVAWRARFPFDFVLMLGDNVYEPHTPDDYVRKFEAPYRVLLDAGVTFHAAIGNHDDPASVYYAPFNMGGERYYTFRRAERGLPALAGAGVRFFALDSRSLDPAQIEWLRRALKASRSAWKICYLHHPLYTSGRYGASARVIRRALEPILLEGNVDVVFAGHEHFYERVVPQRGIVYFTSGGAGSLRRGDASRSSFTAAVFDEDYHFMLVEIAGDQLHFQVVSRGGATVDAGVIVRERS
jgi:hypothetical protein